MLKFCLFWYFSKVVIFALKLFRQFKKKLWYFKLIFTLFLIFTETKDWILKIFYFWISTILCASEGLEKTLTVFRKSPWVYVCEANFDSDITQERNLTKEKSDKSHILICFESKRIMEFSGNYNWLLKKNYIKYSLL